MGADCWPGFSEGEFAFCEPENTHVQGTFWHIWKRAERKYTFHVFPQDEIVGLLFLFWVMLTCAMLTTEIYFFALSLSSPMPVCGGLRSLPRRIN